MVPAFAALAAGAMRRDDYIALLGRLFGFHAPIEAVLANVLGRRFPPETWQRATLLRADLASFGIDDGTLNGLPAIEPPAVPSEAAALGCLYVIEGSTLGGRVLARQVEALIPGRGAAGRCYLQAATQPGRLRWPGLLAEVDAMGADPACLAAMIAAASNTFAQFELWFSDAISTS